MESDLERLLETVSRLPSQAAVTAVFGTPIASEGQTLIPAAGVIYSFDVEAEQSSSEGGRDAPGVGAGSAHITSRPVALLQVAPEGIVVRPVLDTRRLFSRLLIFAGWTAFWLVCARIWRLHCRR